jgi:squalene-hopene/tetraprenyl-beta-curcumene cyclase
MRRLAPFVLASVLLPLAGCGDKPKEGDATTSRSATPANAGGYGYAANLGNDLDKQVGDAIQKGKRWLLGKRDAASGTWGDAKMRIGFTGLATLAVIAATPSESVAKDPTILASLDAIVAAQKPDGSIYANPEIVNYETSVSLGVLAAAKAGPKYATAQAKARDFLANSQIAKDEADPSYGGFPYKDEEPDQPTDLSNLQFALMALHEAGLPADSPVFARAQKYLARVQNRSESNTFVAKAKEGDKEVEVVSGDDGGGFYAPGVSKVGLVKRADGRYEAKSYGSMTYALLKCLLYAGVKPDDPRAVAAFGWITKHFVLDRNPGFEGAKDPENAGKQGYYYYLRTMARALAELEKATGKALVVTDPAGKAHAWRQELGAKVVSLQRADGTWVNASERWFESNPLIATAYAMEALAICQGRMP